MDAPANLPQGSLSRRSTVAALVVYLAAGLGAGWYLGNRRADQSVVDAYARWTYKHMTTTYAATQWLGVPLLQCPIDMWELQEVLYQGKPDVLIETGTYKGGGSLFFASIFDLMGHGRVVTVDVYEYPGLPRNPRITYLLGSSTSPGVLREIKGQIKPGERVMVVLDSDHHSSHVLNELKLYSPLVTIGDYLVVEDTSPMLQFSGGPDAGPRSAVVQFLAHNSQFIQDWSHQNWGYTDYPGGWLKRIR